MDDNPLKSLPGVSDLITDMVGFSVAPWKWAVMRTFVATENRQSREWESPCQSWRVSHQPSLSTLRGSLMNTCSAIRSPRPWFRKAQSNTW